MQQSPEPTPPSEPEAAEVLIEKSLRGALTAAEQVRLGRLLSSNPRVAEELARAQREDAMMQTATERAIDGFDFERARLAIRNRIRWQRRMTIACVGMLALWAPAWALVQWWRTGTVTAGAWVYPALMVLLLTCAWMWLFVRPRSGLARDLAAGDDRLRGAYDREVREIPRRVLMLRVVVSLLIFGGALMLVDAVMNGSVRSAGLALLLFGLSAAGIWQAKRLPDVLSGRAELPGRRDEGKH